MKLTYTVAFRVKKRKERNLCSCRKKSGLSEDSIILYYKNDQSPSSNLSDSNNFHSKLATKFWSGILTTRQRETHVHRDSHVYDRL